MNGEKALVVAGDPEASPEVERLMLGMGFRVLQVRHGAEAARMIRARGPDPVRFVVVVNPPHSSRSLPTLLGKGSRPVPIVPGLVLGGPPRSLQLSRAVAFEHEPVPLDAQSFTDHVRRLRAKRSRRALRATTAELGLISSRPRAGTAPARDQRRGRISGRGVEHLPGSVA